MRPLSDLIARDAAWEDAGRAGRGRLTRTADWSEAETLAIVGRHAHREGPLLPILHEVQEAFGCMCRAAAIPVIAEALNLSRAEVYGVVTFYHDFRDGAGRAARAQALPGRGLPVDGLRGAGGARRGAARHAPAAAPAPDGRDAGGGLLPRPLRDRPVGDGRRRRWSAGSTRDAARRADRRAAGMIRVFVPRDAAALACGADGVAAAIRGEARRAGVEVELVRNGSRGHAVARAAGRGRGRRACAMASGRSTPDGAEALVARALAEGRGAAAVAHPQAVGPVEAIPFLAGQTRLTFARCGITDPLSLEPTIAAHGGWKGLERALALGPEAIVDEVTASGLRGRGGAGFPTGIKWKTVRDAPAPQKYIVCNADEGDSGTFADRMLMEGDPFMLIEGMTIAGLAVGATRGYIYVRSEYPHAIAALSAAIAARRGRPAGSAPTSPARRTPSISRCGSARAPTSAARRPRCSKASKASAASCAPSRRCRRTRACSAGRRSSTTCCRSPRCPSSSPRARRPTPTTAWGARAARCRSSSPATSGTAGCSRPPSA